MVTRDPESIERDLDPRGQSLAVLGEGEVREVKIRGGGEGGGTHPGFG